jgi:DNA modification methylase
VFTSPPYFSAEIYTNEPTQSSIKFKEYSSWRDNFLRPTLETAAQWLKNDRLLAFNIADINVGSKQYPLEEDTVKILEECGLQFKEKLKMVLAKSPSMKINKTTRQPSMKNYCVINGKWRKYEPIFVFYKP